MDQVKQLPARSASDRFRTIFRKQSRGGLEVALSNLAGSGPQQHLTFDNAQWLQPTF